MVEFRESIRIIRQILDGCPRADLVAARREVAGAGQGAEGEAYARVEGPRGEVGCYLVPTAPTSRTA
jgi:NADH-quinone oxidoreductase subunit D